MKDIEWRRPWNLLISRSTHRETILPLKPDVQLVTFGPNMFDKHYYTFQSIDSDLLIAIDHNDTAGVQWALQKDKIDVNTPYMIPFWEVPDAGYVQLQTFLHRALWENSRDVFGLLLQKGANPRINGHCNSTVIDNLFDGHTSKEDIPDYLKMLSAAGVKKTEIRSAIDYKDKKYKSYIEKLIATTYPAKTKITHKEIRVAANNSEHIRN